MFFTSAPIFIYGLYEQYKSTRELTADPYLYRTVTRNKYLTKREFFRWVALGVWHSSVSFFFTYALFAPGASFASNGTVNCPLTFFLSFSLSSCDVNVCHTIFAAKQLVSIWRVCFHDSLCHRAYQGELTTFFLLLNCF